MIARRTGRPRRRRRIAERRPTSSASARDPRPSGPSCASDSTRTRAGCPPGFARDLAGLERFATLLLEAAAPHAAAVKPNLAFFEAYGSAGLAALERLRARLPGDLPVIADAKRGDIGSTAARQAAALFDQIGADAVTVNPYLGAEAVGPLLERLDRFAYVLCRTSNPGAGELQDLEVAADAASGAPMERLHERVARLATGWGPGGTVGLVVGATAPEELARIRAIAPGLAFLVPGVGAQGGAVEPVLEHGPATGRTGRLPAGRRTARQRVESHRGRGGRGRPGGPIRACPEPPPLSGRSASLCYPSRRVDLSEEPSVMPTPGPLELVIILVIALLILGPGKLPDVGSALGKSIREFRKASSDLGDSVKVDTSPLPPTRDARRQRRLPRPRAPAAAAARPPRSPAAPVASGTPSAGTRPSEPTTGTN